MSIAELAGVAGSTATFILMFVQSLKEYGMPSKYAGYVVGLISALVAVITKLQLNINWLEMIVVGIGTFTAATLAYMKTKESVLRLEAEKNTSDPTPGIEKESLAQGEQDGKA